MGHFNRVQILVACLKMPDSLSPFTFCSILILVIFSFYLFFPSSLFLQSSWCFQIYFPINTYQLATVSFLTGQETKFGTSDFWQPEHAGDWQRCLPERSLLSLWQHQLTPAVGTPVWRWALQQPQDPEPDLQTVARRLEWRGLRTFFFFFN